MLLLLLITIISMLLAAIMSAIAWHVAKEEQRRAAARVAALAADIYDERVPLVPRVQQVPSTQSRPAVQPPARRAGAPSQSLPDLDLRPPVERPVAVSGELFSSTESRQPATPIASVAAAVVLVIAGAIALFVVSGYSRSSGVASASTAQRTATAAPANATQPAAAAPLELVELGHERDGDRLTVHGVVRNPSGAAVDGLTAVVFVFNRAGGFVSSARAAVASTALPPGGQADFAVTVPNASDVARYRVSFRTDDRVVPHVDRRETRVAGQEKS